MQVIDPGHDYLLATLDGDGAQRLTFVKREGDLYPGNIGHHAGTTMQEVIRALVERATYVNNQLPCPETESAIALLKTTLILLELRAARRHDRTLTGSLDDIVNQPGCPVCLHVGCTKHKD